METVIHIDYSVLLIVLKNHENMKKELPLNAIKMQFIDQEIM